MFERAVLSESLSIFAKILRFVNSSDFSQELPSNFYITFKSRGRAIIFMKSLVLFSEL